jgi:hypothetical protein
VDGRWLYRFSTRSNWDVVNRAIQARKFHATLPHKIDAEVERVAEIIDLELERHKRHPAIKHEEPTPEQTGDSRLLGGPMSISSPWDDDPEPPSAA